MNAMTCAEVVEQLDFLAANECDPATAAKLHQHLRECAACARQYAASQQLIAQLDAQYGLDALDRLELLIEERSKPARKPRPFFRVIQPVLAAAAVILIAIGVSFWLPSLKPVDAPQFALLVQVREIEKPVRNGEKIQALPAHVLIAKGAEIRDKLRKVERDGPLPLPPRVAIDLTLVNEGKRPVEVKLGDDTTLLSFELDETKVVRVPAPKAKDPEFLQARTLELKPGEKHTIVVDRLIAGSPGKLEYIYPIESGDHEVAPSLRFSADGKMVEVRGKATRVKIVE